MSEQNEFADEIRGDGMRITEGRDWAAWVAIGVTILANMLLVTWMGGKFDQRMSRAEQDIAELKVKGTKDSEQDVQIAVISNQLATISTNVGEIKGKLEQR